MIVKQNGDYPLGYTAITEEHGVHSELLMDFGILKLASGETWTSSEGRERAWLLIGGEVEFQWNGKSALGKRFSFLDENPVVLHVPAGVEVKIRASVESEFCVQMKDNSVDFTPVFYSQEDIRCDVFGGGVMDDTSIRTVRTVFDGEIAPYSNMVLGEVINHPGRWSSYPPHHHPQPEIYHYRTFPKQGFGVSLLDEDAHVVKDGDTCLIPPGKTHSQVAGAGYAMYYIWMIPHLPQDRWLPSTRYVRKGHDWLSDPDVKIWPERKFQK